MKITLNYNVSVTFDVDPGEIADALDPDATPAQIEESCDETIDAMAAESPPSRTTYGRAELIAKVTKLLKAAP